MIKMIHRGRIAKNDETIYLDFETNERTSDIDAV